MGLVTGIAHTEEKHIKNIFHSIHEHIQASMSNDVMVRFFEETITPCTGELWRCSHHGIDPRHPPRSPVEEMRVVKFDSDTILVTHRRKMESNGIVGVGIFGNLQPDS